MTLLPGWLIVLWTMIVGNGKRKNAGKSSKGGRRRMTFGDLLRGTWDRDLCTIRGVFAS